MATMWCSFIVMTVVVALWTSEVITEESYHGYYTDEVGIEIDGDLDTVHALAKTHGLTVQRQVSSLGDVYVFKHESLESRSKRSAEDVIQVLKQDPRVKRVEQQVVLHRTKRRIVHDKQWELPIARHKDKSMYQRYTDDSRRRLHTKDDIPGTTGRIRDAGFNDPYFPDQWYLINEGQTGGKEGYDVNVLPVWQRGITGEGIVVSILDDGIDHTHPDLQRNYDPEASADMNDRHDRDNDPMPNVKDSSNSHGTRCAGEVAAQANNSNCGVGIAFNAKIGGVRMLDGAVTDMLEAEALTYKNQHVDIYSSSWGPSDDGKTIEGPGQFASGALETGVTEGRGGLGSIFVWATGNGGMVEDDCSCDGYVSSIYTLSVGCISDRGLSTYFSEMCPSTMAVIFTGGAHEQPGIGHRGDNPQIKVVTTDLDGECTLEFQGTSSAAPLAAGCFALVLEANPNLTWRDVQNIVVHTARIPNAEEEGWTVNGAGFHVNHKFGFGAIDCGKMVEVAQSWQTVPQQHQCVVEADNPAVDIIAGDTVNQTLHTSGCLDDSEHRVVRLEHVQVRIELSHEKRGDLTLRLISPWGTCSDILSIRPLDDSDEGLDFTFMTVHSWGEEPTGDWTLSVIDAGRGNKGHGDHVTGELKAWSLILWGWAEERTSDSSDTGSIGGSTNSGETTPTAQEAAHNPQEIELKHIMADEEVASENIHITGRTEDTGNDVQDTQRSNDRKSDSNTRNQDDSINDSELEFLRELFDNTGIDFSSDAAKSQRTEAHRKDTHSDIPRVKHRKSSAAGYTDANNHGYSNHGYHRRTGHSLRVRQRSMLDDVLERLLPEKDDPTEDNKNTETKTTPQTSVTPDHGDDDDDAEINELIEMLTQYVEAKSNDGKTQTVSDTDTEMDNKRYQELLDETQDLLDILEKNPDLI